MSFPFVMYSISIAAKAPMSSMQVTQCSRIDAVVCLIHSYFLCRSSLHAHALKPFVALAYLIVVSGLYTATQQLI